MFGIASHLHPSLIVVILAVNYLMLLYSKVRLIAFSRNIKQGWKWVSVTNAHAYSATVSITATKNSKA